MANKRKLKKEIKYLVNDLIAECEVYMKFHPEADREKIEKTILALKDKEKSIIAEVNTRFPEKSPSERKKHYNSILNTSKNDLIAMLDKQLPKAGK